MANNLLIQLMYIPLYMLLRLFNIPLLLGNGLSQGLWPILMLEIVRLCNANPEANMRYFCCPFEIKAKYYPWLLLLIFSIFMFSPDILCGMLIGYLRNE